MYKTFTLLLLGCIIVAQVSADTMDTGGVKYDGTFLGYQKGVFTFTTSGRKTHKEQATRVKSLTFDNQVEINFQTADDKSPRKGSLKSYALSYFLIEVDGKEEKVHYMKMRELTKGFSAAVSSLGGEASRTARSGDVYPIPAVNIAAVEAQDLSVAQQGTLSRFKSAKKAYDEFIRESSAMVQQMNLATGAQREKLLDALRMRKNAEQPFRNSLTASYKALESELPGGTLNPQTARAVPSREEPQPVQVEERAEEIIFDKMIIDEPAIEIEDEPKGIEL